MRSLLYLMPSALDASVSSLIRKKQNKKEKVSARQEEACKDFFLIRRRKCNTSRTSVEPQCLRQCACVQCCNFSATLCETEPSFSWTSTCARSHDSLSRMQARGLITWRRRMKSRMAEKKEDTGKKVPATHMCVEVAMHHLPVIISSRPSFLFRGGRTSSLS